MTIYERIKKRRKELGLSAEQVAKALGVSRATVYRYESKDIEKIPFDAIQPLADVLQCPAGLTVEKANAIIQVLSFCFV